MNPAIRRLEDRILDDIPLARHISVKVSSYDGSTLILEAPLAANSNHQGTAFGGSLFSVATLAAWGLLALKLKEHELRGEVVIQESSVNYTAPVTRDFTARAQLPEAAALKRFLTTVRRFRKGRVRMHVTVEQDGLPAVQYQGLFAVVQS